MSDLLRCTLDILAETIQIIQEQNAPVRAHRPWTAGSSPGGLHWFVVAGIDASGVWIVDSMKNRPYWEAHGDFEDRLDAGILIYGRHGAEHHRTRDLPQAEVMREYRRGWVFCQEAGYLIPQWVVDVCC